MASTGFEHLAAVFTPYLEVFLTSTHNYLALLTDSTTASFLADLLLVPDHLSSLTSAITTSKAWDSLCAMSAGAPPGPDGLPVGFYRVFWSEVGTTAVHVFNTLLIDGRIPRSFRTSRIFSCPKITSAPLVPMPGAIFGSSTVTTSPSLQTSRRGFALFCPFWRAFIRHVLCLVVTSWHLLANA